MSLAHQAAYLNQSDWLAYRTPRVRAVAQYELFDDPHVSAFNTGLRFADGRPKRALAAFRMPLWVERRGRRVTVFGQARPADAGETVAIEFHAPHRRYRTLVDVRLHNPRGYLTWHLRARRGYWRLAWTRPGGRTYHSRTAVTR